MLPYGSWPANARRSSGTTEYNAEAFSVVLIKVKSRDKKQVRKWIKSLMWRNTWNFPQPSQVNTTRWFISGDPHSTAKRASKATQLKQFRQDSHREQADTTGEDTCVLVQPLEPRWDVLTCFKKHYTPTLGKQSETTPVSLTGGAGQYSGLPSLG